MTVPQVQNEAVITLPNLYKYGLVIDWQSRNLLGISSGMCRDANNIMDIEVGYSNVENEAPIIPPLLLNPAINGLNGLDIGALQASTVYAIYMIADSRYYLQTGCIATVATNVLPIIPYGYDSYRLIGYWPTTSEGSFAQGVYSGIGNDMNFRWLDGFNGILISATSASFTTVSLGAFIPPVNNTLVTFMVNYIDTAGLSARILSPVLNAGGAVFVSSQVTGVPMTFQANQNTEMVEGFPSLGYVTSATGILSLYMNGFEVSV